MHLLVTRPEPDAGRLAARLEALGYKVTCAPLMKIRRRTDAVLDLTGVQAVAFTSANGVRAFAAAEAGRSLPVFAVGAATAEAARACGFTDVHTAGGDVTSLAALMAADLDPACGPVFHAAGRHVAGDLARILSRAGIEVQRQALYEAVAEIQLPASAVRALDESAPRLQGVLFFSPRSAKLFEKLAAAAGCSASLGGIAAYCLSPAVAGALTAGLWERLVVARAPDETSLLARLPRAET